MSGLLAIWTSLPQEVPNPPNTVRNGSPLLDVDLVPSALPRKLSTLKKAFEINPDAGTIAKSISAYEMEVSDAICGPSKRYGS